MQAAGFKVQGMAALQTRFTIECEQAPG